jgi:ABC-type dipeptide/oligopeptide/nickel transport system ATPase component
MNSPLLSVNLSVHYPSRVNTLKDVLLQIHEGEIVGLAGQSGSGKSTLALAILRLLWMRGATAEGQIVFEGRNLMRLSEAEMRQIRGRRIGLVLQSPAAALNPALTLGAHFREGWKAHESSRSGDWKQRAVELLASVVLPAEASFLRLYPRELSVGMAQRLMIALAIQHRPALLIADEATSALDVITQAEILELLRRLNRELQMAILFISHDLPAVASLCHRVAILHEGEIVETAATSRIFSDPEHPYTQRLIASLPVKPAELSLA